MFSIQNFAYEQARRNKSRAVIDTREPFYNVKCILNVLLCHGVACPSLYAKAFLQNQTFNTVRDKVVNKICSFLTRGLRGFTVFPINTDIL